MYSYWLGRVAISKSALPPMLSPADRLLLPELQTQEIYLVLFRSHPPPLLTHYKVLE